MTLIEETVFSLFVANVFVFAVVEVMIVVVVVSINVKFLLKWKGNEPAQVLQASFSLHTGFSEYG